MAPKHTLQASDPPAKRNHVSKAHIPPGATVVDLDELPDANLREFINITEDERTSPEPASAQSTFRFLDLPAEIRREVYHHLLPHELRINFSSYVRGPGQQTLPNFVNGRLWRASATHGDGTWMDDVDMKRELRTETSLFLVNKLVSSEARAVVYGENIYVFSIDDRSHAPRSFQSPEIFGLLGDPIRLPLLRNLRSIELAVVVGDDTHWAVKRHRARIEHFINILKEHSDDEEQKSLLKYLKVRCERKYHTTNELGHRMYGIESLAALQGIEYVEVTGTDLPGWYKKCLELCVSGKGGDVKPLDYPDVMTTKKVGQMYRKRKKTVWQTTRQWHQPLLNWEEYAQKNGVELPIADHQLGWHN